MKNVVKYLSIVLIFLLASIIPVNARDKEIKLYFFNGNGCPHCKAEEKQLTKLTKKYKNLKVVNYEVWDDKNNQILFEKVKDKMNIKSAGVPLTIIGTSYIAGYDEAVDSYLERAIIYYMESDNYIDIVSKIKNNTFKDQKIVDYFKKYDKKSDSNFRIKLPFIGKVNLKNVSITTATGVIGFIDGFNPCAMWVLLFIIGMLIGMKDKKRKWIIGLTFILTSALMYMLIMFSWMGIVFNISASILFRKIIAIIAIIGAIINIRSYIRERKEDNGCQVIDSKKRKKIITRIKKFTSEKSLIIALIGVIALAISVNIVELACSAALPLVFTELLRINNINGIEAFWYILIYIVFFMLDDIVVFSIAMATSNIKAISTKYNKYSHLFGGIIMLIIGILLIIKPEWLMFNFN